MSDMRFESRMSDSDALMWHIEKDPLLRSTITAIAVLDRAPDRHRLLERIDRGTRDIPRLRQRVVSPPLGVAPPEWVVDPNFDPSYHVRWAKAPGDGSMRALLDLAAPLAMQSFDRARPLWEFTVVEGLAEGRAALIQKIHHSVTDGVGGIKLALMLLDTEREPAAELPPMPPAPAPRAPRPAELVRDGVLHERRRQLGIARRAASALPRALRDPFGVARATAETLASTARLMTPAYSPLSPLMTERSLSVRFDTLTASLPDLKRAARSAGGRLNDAFLAGVGGGLARYHERHGVPVAELRVTMPINVRTDDTEGLAGNAFAPARFAVPVGIEDPVLRMQAIRDIVAAQRAEPALALADSIAGVINRLPTTLVTQVFGGMLKGVDFVASNVPGLPFRVFLCGAELEAQFALGPLTGAATNVTLLSYLDDIHIGVNTDPAAIPDPDLFLECLREAFDEIAKVD